MRNTMQALSQPVSSSVKCFLICKVNNNTALQGCPIRRDDVCESAESHAP